MSSIEELKTEYETAQHFANVAKDKAIEARIVYTDALIAEKTAEIEAKGIVLGQTKVKISYPGKLKPGTMVEEKGLFIPMNVAVSRWDVNRAHVNCAKVTKTGRPSQAPGGMITCHDGYVYEIVT
jgi:hypothetical protein